MSEQRKRAFFIPRARNVYVTGPGAVARGPGIRGPAGGDAPRAVAAAKTATAIVITRTLRMEPLLLVGTDATIASTPLDY